MGEGIWGILIVLVIAAYCVFVIRKKVRDIKAGRFCGCGCSGCKGACAFPERKQEMERRQAEDQSKETERGNRI